MSYLYFYSKDHEIKALLRASNVKIMLSEKIVCSVYSVCSCCNELYTCETSVWSVFVHANAFMRVSVTCLLMRGSVRLTSQCLMEWLITSDFYSYGCSVNSDIFGEKKTAQRWPETTSEFRPELLAYCMMLTLGTVRLTVHPPPSVVMSQKTWKPAG